MDPSDRQVNRAQLANLLDVAVTTVSQWVQKGCPYVQKGTKGRQWIFNVADVVRWKEEQARQSVVGLNDAIDLDEAKLRKTSAEAAMAELELGKRRGDLLEIEDVVEAVADDFMRLRQKILAIPTKLAPQAVGLKTIPEAEALIQPFVDEALEELIYDGILRGKTFEAEAEGGSGDEPEAAAQTNRLAVG